VLRSTPWRKCSAFLLASSIGACRACSSAFVGVSDAACITVSSELSRFIAAGRLNCKIDKVGGIVETNRCVSVLFAITPWRARFDADRPRPPALVLFVVRCCCRPDAKNTQYSAVIKQGDLLLNRIQKLSKLSAY
jgi:hypothetical protein